MRKARLVLAVALAAVASMIATGGARADQATLGFQPMITLSNDPSQPVGVGGEPSLQDDGRGHVYVTSPTGLATATVNATGVLKINEATGGGALWRSLDGGKTFANPTNPIFFGTKNGGGDTDVTADNTGVLYTADLEAAAADVQRSTDQGTNLTPATTGQNGPDDDREWLTPIGNKLFLTYHDFTVNVDIVMVSTNGGMTFTPAGTGGKIINPLDNPQAASDCFNGNLLSKPVTDANGGLYVLLNCSTFPQNLMPTGAPLDRLYIAISRNGGQSFHTTLVSDVSNNQTSPGAYGRVFNQLGIDAASNVYIAASGNLHSGDTVHTFLIRSGDNGTTWQAPIDLNADTPNFASVFPAIATGQAGQVAAGYYRAVACRPGFATCKTNDYRTDGLTYQFFITQTLDAMPGKPGNPVFTTTQVTTRVPHYNGICTDGLFCGTPLSSGGNRNLADFESMTVDPTGHIELIIPADPGNLNPTDTTPTVNWYFKQTSGPLMVPGATNGNGTGNETYVAASMPPNGQVPESRWAALLLVGGTAVAAVLTWARRRRRGVVAA